ncbi:MAG: ComEC family competence protein [Alphaproteobacteria bacterium]|nr:ComEC family competence protein [Alphaproteobacteria bacterium]
MIGPLRRKTRLALMLVLFPCLGFTGAQWRTFTVQTPVLAHKIGPVEIEGRIEAIEDLGHGAGARLVLRDIRIEGFEASDTPVKVRLKVRGGASLRIGQRVEALVALNPPSGPVMPGGFDFRRYMYFKQIGGIGFSYREPVVVEGAPSTIGVYDYVEHIRRNVAAAIEESLKEPQAGIAMALIVGRRGAVSDEDMEAVRAAGLAHMLAISGLHIGLFSGVVFFVIRFLMALVPSWGLQRPIKKYAAGCAIAAAFAYMLLAGANIPAQRAMMMTGIVFLAVILDRSPLSLRLVAFAASVVLLLFPESLLSASFQMSFAAVSALILFYNATAEFWGRMHRKAGFTRKAALYFLGVCTTTMIASIATAPFALFHFQQFALYSLLANFIAVPILAFAVMPAAVLALFAMLFGLESFPLHLMGLGIEAILDTAHNVAALPHGVLRVGAWPLPALGLLTSGAFVFGVWNGWFRGVGLIPIIGVCILIYYHKQPDILISSDFSLVAYKDQDGSLYISNRRKNAFVRENWEQAYGLEAGEAISWPREGREGDIICGEDGCRLTLKGYHISYIYTESSFAEECMSADLILSPGPLRQVCPSGAFVIDRFDVRKNGSYAIFLEAGGMHMENTASLLGRRPWVEQLDP